MPLWRNMNGVGWRLISRLRSSTAARLAIVWLALVPVAAGVLGGITASYASAPFIPGSGDASAQVFRVAPRTAGLMYASTIGEAFAHYQGTDAKTQTQPVDLGPLATSLTAGHCGAPPVLRADQLPQPLIVESTSGPNTRSRMFASGGGLDLGRETDTAKANALSIGDVTGAGFNLAGVVVDQGGHDHVEAQLTPGVERRATADVTQGEIDIAGVVKLTGLQWHAEHRSGANPGADGSFQLGGVKLAGLPLGTLPGLQLQKSVDAVNAVIVPMGARLQLPVVQKSPDGLSVLVTPLTLKIGGAASVGPIVGSIVHTAQPLRDALTSVLFGTACNGAMGQYGYVGGAVFSLIDIGLNSAAGSGEVDFEIGGVSAGTEGIAYKNPFGDGLGLTPPDLSQLPVPLSISSLPEAPPPPSTAGGTAAVLGNRVVGSVSEICVTTNPFARTRCWTGVGVLAGSLALGVTVLIFAADLGRSRWRRVRARRALTRSD